MVHYTEQQEFSNEITTCTMQRKTHGFYLLSILVIQNLGIKTM